MTQAELRTLCRSYGELLHLPVPNQVFVRVIGDEQLRALAHRLREMGFYLVTIAGTDERDLLDNCFKLTYLFSEPADDLFLFVENALGGASSEALSGLESSAPDPGIETTYTSVCGDFVAADPFERELVDMLGIGPADEHRRVSVRGGDWLHRECYPPDLYPLRRDRTTEELRAAIEAYHGVVQPIPDPPDGEWLLPVGPIHAGVIEPGRFLFRLAGEVIEEVGIRLGYTHKGIERLFQTYHTLEDGWRLAEHVAGDSAFAHSLAYCQAAEALADAHPPREADLLRGLFLELERMANHIGDCGALAHDVAYDVVAMELAALRERIMQLCARLTGHRFLRGVNHPGGVTLPQALDVDDVHRVILRDVGPSFGGFASHLAQLPAFRSRLQWMGILSEQEARRLGVTGLAARASGVRRDFRLQHPSGIYRDQAMQRLVEGGLPPPGDSIQAREASAGDAFARFLARVREVGSSARIVEYILAQWELLDPALRNEREFSRHIRFKPEHNFEFGLGCVEGWRGDVIYWLMQDKFGRIFRCQVRDPSVLNWPGLKAAVDRHPLDRAYRERHKQAPAFAEIILADFPIVNKLFNLSYSGNDR